MQGIKYQCYKCESVFSKPYSYCPYCGGVLLATYNFTPNIRGDYGLSKYIDFLPIDNLKISLGEGGTPLIQLENTIKELRLKNLFVKDESRNPTGSFVDRGIVVFINYYSKERKFVCATTGDTGVSLAAYSAKIGAEVEVYAPIGISEQKVFQMILYGADLHLVEDYSKAKYLSVMRASNYVYFSEESPLYIEGVKTIALELFESLDNIDAIIAPMGSGALIFALWKGFKELKDFGYISKIPRLFGVRIEGEETIIASDLGLRIPTIGILAERAIHKSGGEVVIVDTEAIRKFTLHLIRREGLLIDPAGVVSIAGLEELKRKKRVNVEDILVAILTGSGLKTIGEIESLITPHQISRVKIEARFGRKWKLGRTKLEILKILNEKPLHGYALMKELRKRGKRVAFSTLYQHLSELTQSGLIIRIPKRIKGRKVIIYSITENGKKLLRESITI